MLEDFDPSDTDIKTIEVKRSVFEAGNALSEQAENDERKLTDWNLAEEQRELAIAAGDEDKADFWHEVFTYLMTCECAPSGVPVIVIED